eukprot:1150633-Pelagomonas_calceolata.AAC.3
MSGGVPGVLLEKTGCCLLKPHPMGIWPNLFKLLYTHPKTFHAALCRPEKYNAAERFNGKFIDLRNEAYATHLARQVGPCAWGIALSHLGYPRGAISRCGCFIRSDSRVVRALAAPGLHVSAGACFSPDDGFGVDANGSTCVHGGHQECA